MKHNKRIHKVQENATVWKYKRHPSTQKDGCVLDFTTCAPGNSSTLMQDACQMTMHVSSIAALHDLSCFFVLPSVRLFVLLLIRLNMTSVVPGVAFLGLAAAPERRQRIHPGRTRAAQTSPAISLELALPT